MPQICARSFKVEETEDGEYRGLADFSVRV